MMLFHQLLCFPKSPFVGNSERNFNRIYTNLVSKTLDSIKSHGTDVLTTFVPVASYDDTRMNTPRTSKSNRAECVPS